MPPIRRLAFLFASLRGAFGARDRGADEPNLPQHSAEPELDAAEEFQKLQRGLRRLSLASDRSTEILQAVSTRLDEMQQTLVKRSRPQDVALALGETELLHILDQLDRAADVVDPPASARALVDGAKSALLAGAGWQPLAITGAKPEGVGIRIAEFVGDSPGSDHADARIHRILEQGYRRGDGTLVRPGVVIAAATSNSSLYSVIS
jgi:molecular chaperone GrpE (heat shock protein)